MHLALNMAKMAKGGFSQAAIQQTHFLINTPWAEVREKEKYGVEFAGNNYVKAAMERHLAMHRDNQTDGCLPCQTSTAQYSQTCWRCKGMGAPPPERLSQPTPEPTLHPPRMPPAPPGDNDGAHLFEIEGVPPGYVYIYTPLPSGPFLNIDACAKDRKRDNECNPDLLTDEGMSTGLYTICRVVIQLTSILQTTAAYWVNLTVKMSIDRMERAFWVYYYLQLVDTLKYILKDIFICIIKEQCSDEGETTWRWYKGSQHPTNDLLGQIKWEHIVDMPIAK